MLPEGSVAVAVMNWPVEIKTGELIRKFILAFPPPSVVTTIEPMNFCPSPNPEGSQAILEKNSSIKVVLGVLLSVP